MPPFRWKRSCLALYVLALNYLVAVHVLHNYFSGNEEKERKSAETAPEMQMLMDQMHQHAEEVMSKTTTTVRVRTLQTREHVSQDPDHQALRVQQQRQEHEHRLQQQFEHMRQGSPAGFDSPNKKYRDRMHGYRRPTFVEFTFDPPESYSGPVVEGWEPMRDRNLNMYVKPEFLVLPRTRGREMLVVVHSAPKYFRTRMGIRRSWGGNVVATDNMALVFLLGTDEAAKDQVKEEAELYGDILQADFVDHYNNLTLKTMFTFKYLLKTEWAIRPEYLFKCDDDSYVNPPALLNIFRQRENNGTKFIMGRILGDIKRPSLPLQVPKSRRRLKYTKKWWCPRYMFNGREYPTAVSGAGYALNVAAADCLYREVLKLPFFHLEDILVTGFGAQRCGISVEDNEHFRNSPSRIDEIRTSDVLVHYSNSRAKNRILKVLLFDELQKKYNQLIKENKYVVPDNDYFENMEDEKDITTRRTPKSAGLQKQQQQQSQ